MLGRKVVHDDSRFPSGLCFSGWWLVVGRLLLGTAGPKVLAAKSKPVLTKQRYCLWVCLDTRRKAISTGVWLRVARCLNASVICRFFGQGIPGKKADNSGVDTPGQLVLVNRVTK
jgi:hypothetical protein